MEKEESLRVKNEKQRKKLTKEAVLKGEMNTARKINRKRGIYRIMIYNKEKQCFEMAELSLYE